MTKRPIRCIIAGFDPFGSATFNPSGEIALAFPNLITIPEFREIPTEKLLLPTCCSESWKVLLAALKKFADEDLIVILLGLNERGKNLHLERLAVNLRKYRIPDNNGHQPLASKIYMSEGESRSTRVKVDEVVSNLLKNGIPCEVSDNAGTFVCNEIYFRALSHQAEHKNVKLTLFIHLPRPEAFAATVEEAKQDSSRSASKKKKQKSSQVDSKSGSGMEKKNEASKKDSKVTRPQNPAHLALLQDAVQSAIHECLAASLGTRHHI